MYVPLPPEYQLEYLRARLERTTNEWDRQNIPKMIARLEGKPRAVEVTVRDVTIQVGQRMRVEVGEAPPFDAIVRKRYDAGNGQVRYTLERL